MKRIALKSTRTKPAGDARTGADASKAETPAESFSDGLRRAGIKVYGGDAIGHAFQDALNEVCAETRLVQMGTAPGSDAALDGAPAHRRDQDARTRAFHEAGHVVVARMMGAEVAGAWIAVDDAGRTSGGFDLPAEPDRAAVTGLRIQVAGACAEWCLRESRDDDIALFVADAFLDAHGDDRQRFYRLAEIAHGGTLSVDAYAVALNESITVAVEMLRARWQGVVAVAQGLLEERRLTSDDIDRLMDA